MVAVDLSIFEYGWTNDDTASLTDSHRPDVGVTEIIRNVVAKHFQHARLLIMTSIGDDDELPLIAAVADSEHMSSSIDYAKCPLIVRKHGEGKPPGRVLKARIADAEKESREYVACPQYNYYKVPKSNGLLRHESHPITFTLVVNEFCVKYVDRADVEH